MRYEWDEAKRLANIAKHGLDFLDVDLIYEAPDKITLDVTRAADQEPRCADLAEVNGRVLKLVYTLRGRVIRCISLRVASRKETRLYHEAKDG